MHEDCRGVSKAYQHKEFIKNEMHHWPIAEENEQFKFNQQLHYVPLPGPIFGPMNVYIWG